MSEITLHNHEKNINYVVDTKSYGVLINRRFNDHTEQMVIPLSDILNIAAIYKAGANENAAKHRKERYIKSFGSQQSLNFREEAVLDTNTE